MNTNGQGNDITPDDENRFVRFPLPALSASGESTGLATRV